jgi:hypothetical protein
MRTATLSAFPQARQAKVGVVITNTPQAEQFKLRTRLKK